MTTRHPTANASQRARRTRIARIDYYPSSEALALIESRRTRYGPTHNNSGIIDTIIAEWVVFAGLKQSEVEKPKTPASVPELCNMYARTRMTSDAVNSTHMRVTSDDLAECAGGQAGTSSAEPQQLGASQARVGANDFDPRHAKPGQPREGATGAPEFIDASARANESGFCHAKRAGAHANKFGSLPARAHQARVICGARRRRDGEPCQALSVPGKLRCKWHGGASTGPRTDAGRARSMANLRQYRNRETDLSTQ